MVVSCSLANSLFFLLRIRFLLFFSLYNSLRLILFSLFAFFDMLGFSFHSLGYIRCQTIVFARWAFRFPVSFQQCSRQSLILAHALSIPAGTSTIRLASRSSSALLLKVHAIPGSFSFARLSLCWCCVFHLLSFG